MNADRRNFVQAMIPVALAALAFGGAAPFAAAQQPSAAHPPGSPGPSMPPDPRDKFPDIPKVDPKVILQHNQQQIHDDVLKLYELAGQLKEQVGKTDSTTVLSMPLIQKAEEVEKLAKQIKTLARGS